MLYTLLGYSMPLLMYICILALPPIYYILPQACPLVSDEGWQHCFYISNSSLWSLSRTTKTRLQLNLGANCIFVDASCALHCSLASIQRQGHLPSIARCSIQFDARQATCFSIFLTTRCTTKTNCGKGYMYICQSNGSHNLALGRHRVIFFGWLTQRNFSKHLCGTVCKVHT